MAECPIEQQAPDEGIGSTVSSLGTENSPTRQKCEESELIKINISGLKFMARERVLHRYPETLLGDVTRRKDFYCPDTDDYFFDRHRPSFEAIFDFYQTGKLVRPPIVPVDIFFAELKFFGIDNQAINAVLDKEGYRQKSESCPKLPDAEPKRTIWLLFEYPETSFWARIVAILSVCAIIISIASSCAETIPQYQEDKIFDFPPNTTRSSRLKMAYGSTFYQVETACIVWFCFELLVRFYASPDKVAFIKDIMNIIDMIAIVPYFLTLIFLLGNVQGSRSAAVFMRVLRLIRVSRILKLSRHMTALRILGRTLILSAGSIGLLFLSLFGSMVLFGTFVYFADLDTPNTDFESVPATFWWAVITMTTVGYGDEHPRSPMGKLAGGVCVLSGIMFLLVPVPGIVANFNRLYTRQRNVLSHDLNTTQDEREKETKYTWRKFVAPLKKKNKRRASSGTEASLV
ncbi:PREDICTED: potassium voltage-gated channel subfamily A member 3-like [Branchiostoma belcheri]|uniref:Potassium voltage-gated channel subfamily A member 3-like n=1 Tax=Branchiostoma belcheri TaxID=7741 RepID=A0A6P5A5M2_BRABE|nr:PREDICTED: potassium voltage-gated channel subfamily A member 3-like [Branchiostoma belcheri]